MHRLQSLGCYAAHLEELIEERTALAEELSQYAMIKKVYPSETNCLLVQVEDANTLTDQLKADGIQVCNLHHMMPNHIRITVGSPYENYMLLETLRALSLA